MVITPGTVAQLIRQIIAASTASRRRRDSADGMARARATLT